MVRAILDVEQLKGARHIGSLEEPAIRWRHTSDVGIDQHVEYSVDDVGDLLLAAVVVDDDLVE